VRCWTSRLMKDALKSRWLCGSLWLAESPGESGIVAQPGPGSHLRANARHAVDRTARLVLAQCKTSLLMNGFHSLRSICSHTRHDDAHRLGMKRGGDRVHHKWALITERF